MDACSSEELAILAPMGRTYIAVVLALVVHLPAQIFVVDPLGGGTHNNLQVAINAAPSGATIHVRGGIWGPLTITRSITIIGENAPWVRSAATSNVYGSQQLPAITLQGTGTEYAVFAGLEVLGATGSFYGYAGPGIAASGFRHLAIHDCTVRGHAWFPLYDVLPGASAVEATGLVTLHVARSTLAASHTGLPSNSFYTDAGAAGINVPGASVVLLDSTVTGGNVGPMILQIGAPWPGPCPCGPAGHEPGRGGAGVIGQSVFVAGCTITGGSGSVVSTGLNPTVVLGTQPSGLPIIANAQTDVVTTLAQMTPLQLGSTYTVGFAPTTTLSLFAFGSPAPWPSPVIGVQFVLVDVLQPFALRLLPTAVDSVSLTVPDNALLLGFSLIAQRFDMGPSGLAAATNPLVAVVLP